MADKLHVRYCHSLNVTVKKKAKSLLPRSHSRSRSQMQMPEVKVEEIKKAKIMKVSSEDEFTAIVWDFAGQIQYLNTHTVFVRKNNLVFIVFKASCNLSHPTQARPGDQNKSAHVPKASQFKVIHYWLQTVTSVCNDDGDAHHKSERLPTVVLIATHLDEITGDVEAAKKEIILQLAKELEGKPYAKHLFGNREGLQVALEKYCIFISNKDRDPSTIAQLKNIVSQATTPILQEKHPLVYIKIEEKLLLLKEDVITTSDFHKIAVENGFMAEEDSDELNGALTHFHHKGIILHFPAVDGLKELIFLSPQWLEKLISFLVVGHPYKATGDTKDFAYKCLTEDGFLLGTFLAHMLQMFNKRYRFASSEISFEKAVAFLIKFGFIVAVSTKTRLFDSHPEIEIDKENEAFIVPSQLRIAKNDMEKQQNKTDEWSIHFKFMAGFIPPMVYHHMVAACITWSGDRSIVGLTKYEINIVLSKGQLYHVKLSEESSTIQLDIVLVKSLEGAAECRNELISFFRSKLNEMCTEIIPASAKPIPFVPCPNCGNPHIKYDSLIQKKDLHCGTFVPDDWYEGLLTSPGIESTDRCLAHPEVPSTTTDHQDCTDHTSTNTETSKGKPDDTDDSQKFRDNIEKFSPQLLETLPMDDAIFIAKLRSAGLLPGNLKAEIKSLKTSADKADYFLDYVILPNISVNQTNFHKFLKVMEESGNDTLSTLAKDIKKLD
ncbi:uncharacterized protein [Dysidea avara]|uniref:uncharacterized protein n=1 Tax=Dysidea avara TaxID=196820 RepID=UPI003322F5D6